MDLTAVVAVLLAGTATAVALAWRRGVRLSPRLVPLVAGVWAVALIGAAIMTWIGPAAALLIYFVPAVAAAIGVVIALRRPRPARNRLEEPGFWLVFLLASFALVLLEVLASRR